MPANVFSFGSGTISEIIQILKSKHEVSSVRELSSVTKLQILCDVLQFTPAQLDSLIASNPSVLRTVRGHAFEVVFDDIVNASGFKAITVGGDSDVDRIVNGVTLQLKTPTAAGTSALLG